MTKGACLDARIESAHDALVDCRNEASLLAVELDAAVLFFALLAENAQDVLPRDVTDELLILARHDRHMCDVRIGHLLDQSFDVPVRISDRQLPVVGE